MDEDDLGSQSAIDLSQLPLATRSNEGLSERKEEERKLWAGEYLMHFVVRLCFPSESLLAAEKEYLILVKGMRE